MISLSLPSVIPSAAEGFSCAGSSGGVEEPFGKLRAGSAFLSFLLLTLAKTGLGWGTLVVSDVEFSGTTHTCGVFVFAFRSTSTAANRTHFPSGETTGSSTRFSLIMSSKVKGRFSAADGNTTATTHAAIRKRRIPGPPAEAT